MSTVLALIVLLLLALPLAIAIRRSNELFCLEWREHRLVVRRGRPPQGLVNDFADVLRGGRHDRAVLRVVTLDRMPRLEIEGDLGPDVVQQLRNVLGTYPAHKLLAARGRR